MNPEVNWYFNNAQKWQAQIALLRTIILSCNLTEELKWGVPTYTFNKKNIVLIHTFKNYCAILFTKGVLLTDAKKILIQQTVNVQAARQLRFTNTASITKIKAAIKAYVLEACQIEANGLKVALKKTADYKVPQQLTEILNQNPALKKAFEALTAGRQKGYLFYFGQPKQAKTTIARIEKYTEHILMGKGIND